MSTISTNPKVIKLFYSSKSTIGKQTLAYLKSSFKNLLVIDVLKTNVTGTQWKTLASKLDLNVGDLINKDHPSFTQHYSKELNLTEQDWIKVLNAHPEVLNFPIAIVGDQHQLVKNPSDITRYLESKHQNLND